MTSVIEALSSETRLDREEVCSCARRRYGIDKDAIVFLTVGRIVKGKNVDQIVSAFKKVFTVVPNVWLLIVGDGSERKYIEMLAAGIANVVFTGRMEGPSLSNVLRSADVFVAAAHNDQWGLVINEAMSVPLAVIATDTYGCVGDLLIHGNTGWIVSTADSNQIAVAMTELAVNKQMRATLAFQAQAHMRGWTHYENASRISEALRFASFKNRPQDEYSSN